MKYSELEKLLRKHGCYPVMEGHKHRLWYKHRLWFSPKTGARFTVGRHKTEDVRPGTLKSILKAAGIE